MNDLTTQPPTLSLAYSAPAELTVELAKSLSLVAPISMSVEQQELWLRAAIDALDGIRASEVAAISAELRRSVTRPSQIVPEIARLVSARRAQPRYAETPGQEIRGRERAINEESQRRRATAATRAEIERAWQWDRDARLDAGLTVPPIAPPFTRAELDSMDAGIRSMGLKYGFLAMRDGQVIET